MPVRVWPTRPYLLGGEIVGKAICIITENKRGVHQVTFDEHVSPYAWLALPNASGEIIKKGILRRRRKEQGILEYKLLERRVE